MATPHLRTPELSDARALAAAAPGSRATIYLAGPDEPGFAELKDVTRRYRLALGEARRRVADAGDASELGAALQAALDPPELDLAALPRHAWTIASFFGPSLHRLHVLPVRERDAVHVGLRFALLPLLRSAHLARSFRVLALAENRVRLFEGDARELREVELPGVPSDLGEALGDRVEREPDLQYHSGPRGERAPIGEAVRG